MSTECTRSITFTIPGINKSPAVAVKAVEVNGTLVFMLDVLSTSKLPADLNGLFFNFNNPQLLNGLTYSGESVSAFDTGNVIDLGHGVNLKGAATPFDVGLAFGTPGIGQEHITSTTFILSNPNGNLTLDDIANVEFGARLSSISSKGGGAGNPAKLVTTAPAAPDALDDVYTIFEDGQPDLNSPSHTPSATVLEVLANDTDADGDVLTITQVSEPLHGTVEIVDGDDADTLPGDALLYTPDADYSGEESFTYCISDNNGGTDFATVSLNVTAVADVPDLAYEILAGESVNQVIVRVTATQSDLDGSEFIDRIELSGIPGGVSVDTLLYNPSDEPDQIVKDFLLTLPMGEDTDFNLGITAVSKEESNGDEESSFQSAHIAMEYTFNDLDRTFEAMNQSIWSSGDQFTYTNNKFLGINTSWDSDNGGLFWLDTSGHLKAGLESVLTFEGGEIDASVPYNIDVETHYNKSTDVLVISSDAWMNGGSFMTEGPEGSYDLDLLFDIDVAAKAGINVADIINETLLDEHIDRTYDIDLLQIDTGDIDFSVEDPFGAGFSLDLAWPMIETSAGYTGSTMLTASGESNNFLQANLDVDDFVFFMLKLPNPLHFDADIGIAGIDADILDLDIFAGMNFYQEFALSVNGLPGTITYENGMSESFIFGNDMVLTDASDYDTDGDGLIEFALSLDLSATLNNDTDLGFNVGYDFDVLEAHAWYDVSILGIGYSDSFDEGPLYTSQANPTVTTVGVYDQTFALDFASQDLFFVA